MMKLVLAAVVAVVLLLALVAPTGAQEPPSGSPSPLAPAVDGGDDAAAPAAAATDLAIAIVETGPFVPGQRITVEVSGGRPSATVEVAQCDEPDTACGSDRYVTLGPSGSGTVELAVRRRVIGPNRTVVDCAPSACHLLARQWGIDLEAEASAPIEVDPTAPIPKPTVRVATPGPIRGSGPVTVEGAGFDRLDYVQFFECSWDPPSAIVPCAPLPGSATTDGTGAFSTSLSLSRVLLGTDCATRVWRCQVWAVSSGNIDSIWAAPLAFDGSAPPVFPTVTADPSTDLLHLQPVAVAGHGFARSSSVSIAQCTAEGDGSCSTLAYVATDASGAFAGSVAVRRRVGPDDCAVVRCRLRVIGPPVDTVEVDLGFDASVPPPAPPTLTVAPSTGLADRDVVTITVAPVDPGSWISLRQCVTGTSSCRYLPASITVPPDGTAVTEVVVRRAAADGSDCAVVACELRADVSTSGGTTALAVALAFDPDAPPAPPPAVRVLPSTGLWDRQRVVVRGTGFDPWDHLSARQCAGDPAVAGNCTSTAAPVAGDGSGAVNGALVVRRILDLPAGASDCTVVACAIALTGTGGTVVVPIAFDPAGPVLDDDLPPQLECVSWPTEGWPTGPIPAGVDAAAVATRGEQMVGSQGADSVVVIHGGRLVYENYATGLDASSIFPSFSVSKTFTATMVGLLVDDGLLDIDDTSLFPEWSGPGDPRAAISARSILNMSSGLSWNEDYGDATSDVIQLVQSPDPASFVVAKPLAHAPGTYWDYSTGDTMLLSRLIGDAAGVSGPTYEALLHDRLFDPLGIDPVVAGFDDAGRWKAGWLTNTTTRNFAKLGLLYLRHGVWEGQQFLSRDWVDFVRAPSPASPGYGGQVWLHGDGSFSMLGVGGQEVLVVPSLDLIVAVNNGGDAQGMANLFANAAAPTCGATAPAALVDDAATVATDGSVLADVLANDSGGAIGVAPATLTVATPPAHGTATIEAGAIRYQPSPGFAGTDSVGYLVCTADRRSCLEATLVLTVEAPLGARRGDAGSGWLTVSADP